MKRKAKVLSKFPLIAWKQKFLWSKALQIKLISDSIHLAENKNQGFPRQQVKHFQNNFPFIAYKVANSTKLLNLCWL